MNAMPTSVRPALAVALGLALAGAFMGHGFQRGRATDRYVTVKGVSERAVVADMALWSLRFVASDNVLSSAQAKIASSQKAIQEFLSRYGVPDSSVMVQGVEVNDLVAAPYRSGPIENRYIISQGILVRSDKPREIQAISQKVGELVAAGVVLTAGDRMPSCGPTFLFPKLNDLKPHMIAEATANARAAAEQFAQDSRSRLGGIRTANQGVFVILPRDQAPGIMEEQQLDKTVRVVTTVDYYLKD